MSEQKKSVNKVELAGNLGKDAEIRVTPGNKKLTRFSLATTRSWKVGEEWQSETTWHSVFAFGLADEVTDQLKKGAFAEIKGRISIRDYKDSAGNDKKAYEVLAFEVAVTPREIVPTNGTPVPAGDVDPDFIQEDLPF